tara:strand:+ start:89 stop:898 length:810 start_codon:yes stop_codon:yes gene_type:complete
MASAQQVEGDSVVSEPSVQVNDAASAISEGTSIGQTLENDDIGGLQESADIEPATGEGFFKSFFLGIKTLLVLGGPVVWILLLVSIFGLTLAFTKFLQFSRTNPLAIGVIDDAITMWLEGNTAKASGNLERSAVGIAKDIQFGLEMRGTLDNESLQDEMIRRSSAFLRDFSNNLKPLELIYYLAPVMGLLGTVLGMIDAFRGLAVSAGAAGESSALAGGIWEALLTTAVGLSIAIPFAVMHAVLETKLDNLTDQVGDMITRVCAKNEVS